MLLHRLCYTQGQTCMATKMVHKLAVCKDLLETVYNDSDRGESIV